MLHQAQTELAETQRILDEAKARLNEVEEGIATLQAKYEDCVAKKEELENKVDLCKARLGRADKVCMCLICNRSGIIKKLLEDRIQGKSILLSS